MASIEKSIGKKNFIENPYQWGETENALTIWTNILQDGNKVEEYFLERDFTYCEKFDGTNVGKDMRGLIYSRCLVLGMHEKEFINTSLKCMHKTYINSFHKYLMEELDGNHGEDILNIIVIGELMCNPQLHEYETRGLAGRWLVFGVILEVKEESKLNIIEKCKDCGFLVRGRDKVDKIKLCLNKKLAEVFDELRFDCNPKIVKTGTIYEIVKENSERLIKGEIEGLIV